MPEKSTTERPAARDEPGAPPAVMEKAARVRLAVFDVDGVLTDGGLFLSDDGREFRRFHARDGQGLTLLKQAGCQVAVISARSSAAVAVRMEELGIEYAYQGRDHKPAALAQVMKRLGLESEAVAYAGDDLLDLAAMAMAGLALAPADAHPAVRQCADWVTARNGGAGAVRQICDLILKAQGKYDEITARFIEA